MSQIHISESEAFSLLSHEMGNTLMVIQNRLDSMRSRMGNLPAFREIQDACSKSATVLRGAISLIGKQPTPKKLIALGEYLENQLETLVCHANMPLGLRTHEECRVFTSSDTLNLSIAQVLRNLYPENENSELYIEVYPGKYNQTSFAIINFTRAGSINPDKSIWQVLESIMHLQGGDLIIEEPGEAGPKICLMLPIFKKYDSLYTLRTRTEIHSALVVEDQVDVADSVSMTLKALGILNVTVFHQPTQALEWLNTHTPGLVLTDYSMVGMNGIDFLKQASNALASSTVALMSGMPPDNFNTELQSLDLPVKLIMKPLRGDDIMNLVMNFLGGSQDNPDPESLQQTIRIAPQKPRPTAS